MLVDNTICYSPKVTKGGNKLSCYISISNFKNRFAIIVITIILVLDILELQTMGKNGSTGVSTFI